MSNKTYTFNANFKNWKKGDQLDHYEFKRLPIEYKKYAVENVTPPNKPVVEIVELVKRKKSNELLKDSSNQES